MQQSGLYDSEESTTSDINENNVPANSNNEQPSPPVDTTNRFTTTTFIFWHYTKTYAAEWDR